MVARAVAVVADGGAVARRCARDGAERDVRRGTGAGGQGGLGGRPGARGLGEQEPLSVARAVGVDADGGAVARRRARDGVEAGVRRGTGVRGQGGLSARPGARGLGEQEPSIVVRAVAVVADGGAVARRWARDGVEKPSTGAGGQGGLGGRPGARGLGEQEPLLVVRAVGVVADGGAVARRWARDGVQRDGRVSTGAGGQGGLGVRPGTRGLGEQEPLHARAVGVVADGGAVARRWARDGVEKPSTGAGGQGGLGARPGRGGRSGGWRRSDGANKRHT